MALSPIVWADESRVLVRLPMGVTTFLLASKLAAALLGRTQRGMLIEYGPQREAVCAELGLIAGHTLLFVRKPQQRGRTARRQVSIDRVTAPVGGTGDAL